MCEPHRNMHWKPIRGLDRPEHADEDWRPSIAEIMRHAQIEIAFEARKHQAPAVTSQARQRELLRNWNVSNRR